MDGDFHVSTGKAFFQYYLDKAVDGPARIEDIVDEQDFVPRPQVFRSIGPAIHHDAFLFTDIRVGTRDDGCIIDRTP